MLLVDHMSRCWLNIALNCSSNGNVSPLKRIATGMVCVVVTKLGTVATELSIYYGAFVRFFLVLIEPTHGLMSWPACDQRGFIDFTRFYGRAVVCVYVCHLYPYIMP